MKKSLLVSLASSLIVLAAGCAADVPSASGKPPTAEALARRVNELADTYVREFTSTFPEAAFSSGFALPRDNGLTDNSLSAGELWDRKEDAWLAEIKSINGEALWGRPEWITYGLLQEALEARRGVRVCHRELWPFNQLIAWPAKFVGLASAQPVGTPQRRADALARWREVPRYLDTEIANLKEGVRRGYTTPKRNVELALKQLDQLLGIPPAHSPFSSPAQRDPDPEFVKNWTALLEKNIYPAIQSYRTYIQTEYLPAARDNAAITALPDGLECYRASFRLYTSIDRSPQETYTLGERMVEQREAEIRTLGERTFGTSDLKLLARKAESDQANRFKTADEVRAHATEALSRAREALPKWFGRIPKAPFSIVAIPDALAASASPHYQSAAQDGSRPGIYYINLYQPEKQLRSRNEVVAFHEVYPGHHLQTAVSQELPGVHPVSQLVDVSSYSEGWARYAEALSEEMGLYQSPHSKIGRRFWPARGMVVDTGFHVLGWSREKAVQYIAAGHIPFDPEALADRIVIGPGQLTSYDTGAAEIFALRDEAQKQLGARFDLREFHDQILSHGSITLRMLRRVIEHWIAEKQGAVK